MDHTAEKIVNNYLFLDIYLFKITQVFGKYMSSIQLLICHRSPIYHVALQFLKWISSPCIWCLGVCTYTTSLWLLSYKYLCACFTLSILVILISVGLIVLKLKHMQKRLQDQGLCIYIKVCRILAPVTA